MITEHEHVPQRKLHLHILLNFKIKLYVQSINDNNFNFFLYDQNQSLLVVKKKIEKQMNYV